MVRWARLVAGGVRGKGEVRGGVREIKFVLARLCALFSTFFHMHPHHPISPCPFFPPCRSLPMCAVTRPRRTRTAAPATRSSMTPRCKAPFHVSASPSFLFVRPFSPLRYIFLSSSRRGTLNLLPYPYHCSDEAYHPSPHKHTRLLLSLPLSSLLSHLPLDPRPSALKGGRTRLRRTARGRGAGPPITSPTSTRPTSRTR